MNFYKEKRHCEKPKSLQSNYSTNTITLGVKTTTTKKHNHIRQRTLTICSWTSHTLLQFTQSSVFNENGLPIMTKSTPMVFFCLFWGVFLPLFGNFFCFNDETSWLMQCFPIFFPGAPLLLRKAKPIFWIVWCLIVMCRFWYKLCSKCVTFSHLYI